MTEKNADYGKLFFVSISFQI